MDQQHGTVVVIGLGYVGLPLAVALARKMTCWGFDIDSGRIKELAAGHDRTGEIESARLAASTVQITSTLTDIPPADFYIVTVPTPVDSDNRPNLGPLLSATRTVAKLLDAQLKPVIVYESTVYPGVTENICGQELARVSGLVNGRDFFLGYSPERINPGDREHTIDKITKVVSGQDQETLEKVSELYSLVTSGGVFRAASIKAAEAAKVIENAQRDINIAFMNEIAQIFRRMDLSVWDVLAAARTKWNFLPFEPGLVGGHCIGIDPYYLSHCAQELGYDPKVVLAGRRTNDDMAGWVAEAIDSQASPDRKNTLVLGLTFKEDVPDLRNSKVADLISRLSALGHRLTVHDPHADAEEALREYGVCLDPTALDRSYDLVVLAVPHRRYREMSSERLTSLVAQGGMIADLKNALPRDTGDTIRLWTL